MKTPWFAPPAPEGREFNIVDDRTINEKYAGLNPGVEFISNVDRLISDINESLKYVSDKIERDVRKIPEDVVELPTTTTTTEQPPRTVLGCSRVGIIAKGTFIKGDQCAEVVLTCTPVPTSGLVEQIRRLFGESTVRAGLFFCRKFGDLPVCRNVFFSGKLPVFAGNLKNGKLAICRKFSVSANCRDLPDNNRLFRQIR